MAKFTKNAYLKQIRGTLDQETGAQVGKPELVRRLIETARKFISPEPPPPQPPSKIRGTWQGQPSVMYAGRPKVVRALPEPLPINEPLISPEEGLAREFAPRRLREMPTHWVFDEEKGWVPEPTASPSGGETFSPRRKKKKPIHLIFDKELGWTLK